MAKTTVAERCPDESVANTSLVNSTDGEIRSMAQGEYKQLLSAKRVAGPHGYTAITPYAFKTISSPTGFEPRTSRSWGRCLIKSASLPACKFVRKQWLYSVNTSLLHFLLYFKDKHLKTPCYWAPDRCIYLRICKNSYNVIKFIIDSVFLGQVLQQFMFLRSVNHISAECKSK